MDSTFDPTAVMLLLVLLVPLTGILLAATPYLMRRGEVFAVTVPTAAQRDPYLRQLKRRYAAIMLVATTVLALAGAASVLAGSQTGLMAVLAGGLLALCAGSYALMLRYRSKVRAYKREQGWQAAAQEAVAVVGEDAPELPRAIPLAWNLLYLPVVLATLAIGVVTYPDLPDMVPMQVDFSGTVSRWEPKGPGIVAFPVLVQAFLAACFAFSHWTILRSKKWAEPGAPATSALAYGLFARAQSVYLLVSGVLLAAVIGLAFELSSLGAASLMQVAFAVIAAVFVMVAGAVVLSVVYGQAGSRVFKRMQDSDTLAADEDEHWKLGVFYCNPDDASLFLPERFGVGWTVNWARPAVWAIVAAAMALTAAFVAAVLVLV